jgi:hypothetical protein
LNESLSKNSHLNKTVQCEEKGIQLFHIFENEWIDPQKQLIWKSMLNSAIGKSTRIFARKCIIRDIEFNESNKFLSENHMQGNSVASVRFGLFYNEELVSVMTFGKSRYNKSIQWELMRFASKLNYNVVGGASKLLKYFELNYKPISLLSYANRRWSQGNVYVKLGFEFIENTSPNYFYFHKNIGILESRQKYQKHKLINFENYSDEKTETQIMYEAGYRKIYDSGNKLYRKDYIYGISEKQ